MNVIAAITLQTLTTTIEPGQAFALPDAEAQSLIVRGFAKPAEGVTENVTASVATINNQGAEDKDNNDDNDDTFIQEIVDAIDLLNKDNDFSQHDNKPHVNALSHVLDEHVTAAQRDLAWERYQQQQAADE